MNPKPVKNKLYNLTQQWRNRLLFSNAVKALSVSMPVASLVWLFVNLSLIELFWGTGGAFIVAFLAWSFWGRLKTAKVQNIARHLNRTVPEFEESSELFLKADSSLSVLERLQRNRLTRAVKNLQSNKLLPNKELKSAGIFFAASLFFVITLQTFTSDFLSYSPSKHDAADLIQNEASLPDHDTDSEVKIESVNVQIIPPAYTKKPQRTVSGFNVNAAEGARLSWSITTSQETAKIQLIFSEGDSLLLQPTNGLAYSASRTVWESGFYYLSIECLDGLRQSSQYYRLNVSKDEPPTLVVIKPEQRTVIEPGQPQNVTLRVVAEDDYRITKIHIISTVTQGSGEAVKFREEKLRFDSSTKKTERSYELTKVLKLNELEMAAGDELYFYVEALDNRHPNTNRSRTETYFVNLKDTSGLMLSVSAGLAINPLPEYFRSQRQIIIDTEKLIQDQSQINDREFKRRSNYLGIDQKALRLRYGQFLGEESEWGIGMELTDVPEVAESGDEFDNHAHNELQTEQNKDKKSNIIEQFTHQHDFEENATLFSQSIKKRLKAALAEMWDAELNLRTFQPKQALPYENRALVLLKQAQQESRVYVKRIGFEPPPLKPLEKRLSGDISKIKNKRTRKKVDGENSFASIRKALQVLRKLKTNAQMTAPDDRDILEKAGKELMQQALEHPGRYLKALQDLRELMTNIENRAAIYQDCLLSIEAAFWNVLPMQNPIPEKGYSDDSELSLRYYKKTGASQ